MEVVASDLCDFRRPGESGGLCRCRHEDVDAAAQRLHGFDDAALHRGIVGGVGAHAHHTSAGERGELARAGAQRLLATCQQRHVGAFLRQHAGNRLADAAAAAGHQRALAVQLQVHGVS